MEQFTRAELETVAMIGSWSTLILIFLGLRAAWRGLLARARTLWIGVRMLAD
jgi:hypothetical protein